MSQPDSAPKITSTFGKVFNITDAQFKAVERPGRVLNMELMADPDTVKQLRVDMLADGINVDGKLIGAGSLSMALKTDSPSTAIGKSGEVPGAVTRIEYMDPPVEHPIVLQHVFHKDYCDGQYHVYIVPYAPDVPRLDVTSDDIRRTLQVLKKDGLENNLWDFEPDNFVFLVKPGTEDVIRYPADDTVPEDFRGKPIAFVRDYNAIPAKMEPLAPGAESRAQNWVKGRLQQDLAALPEAPEACVDACKQQYALTAVLAQNLSKTHIKANSNPDLWQSTLGPRTGWAAKVAG